LGKVVLFKSISMVYTKRELQTYPEVSKDLGPPVNLLFEYGYLSHMWSNGLARHLKVVVVVVLAAAGHFDLELVVVSGQERNSVM
jgi:hypothetical protein